MANFQLPIADCNQTRSEPEDQPKTKSAIGNRKSPMNLTIA